MTVAAGRLTTDGVGRGAEFVVRLRLTEERAALSLRPAGFGDLTGAGLGFGAGCEEDRFTGGLAG